MNMGSFMRRLLLGAVLSLSLTLPVVSQPNDKIAARPPAGPPTEAAALRSEAVQHEKQGRWLGAVAAWREVARLAQTQDPQGYEQASERLYDLAGLSWMASIKGRDAYGLQVGKDVVALSYRTVSLNGTKQLMSGFDRRKGTVLWTREDAVAFPYHGDMAVFVHSWDRVARINPQNGAVTWEVNIAGAARVLGIHDDAAIVQGDGWPAAVGMDTGKFLWGPYEKHRGYRAMLTSRGVLTWPGDTRPAGMAEEQWEDSPMVMLTYNGAIAWTRPLLAGEPWQVCCDDTRAYISDQRLEAESPWTAISLENGQTCWRQIHVDARPSTLTPAAHVLIQGETGSRAVEFLDPRTGQVKWRSEGVVSIAPDGPVLERAPGGGLVARDLDTGSELWKAADSDESQIDASQAVLGQSLYFPTRGPGVLSGTDTPGALAADRSTGKIQWRHHGEDAPYAQEWHTLATAGDMLLLECQSQIPNARLTEQARSRAVTSLLSLDSSTGDVAWGFWDLAPARTSPPVRAGNTLFVVGGDRDGATVYAFDLEKIKTLVKSGKRWWW